MEQENPIVSSTWILLEASSEALSRAVAGESSPIVGSFLATAISMSSQTQVRGWKESTNTKKEAKVDMSSQETIKSR